MERRIIEAAVLLPPGQDVVTGRAALQAREAVLLGDENAWSPQDADVGGVEGRRRAEPGLGR